jgi:hypothetical protein
MSYISTGIDTHIHLPRSMYLSLASSAPSASQLCLGSLNPTSVTLPTLPSDEALSQANFTNVRFWTKRDWSSFQKVAKGISDANCTKRGERGNARASHGENVMMQYVEDEQGNPISGDRAGEIRRAGRSLWTQLATAGVAPKTWTKADMNSSEFFKHEMRKRFPELRLCEANWKIEQIAIDYYPSWHTHHSKEAIVKREGEDATYANKRRRLGEQPSDKAGNIL